MSKKLLCFVLTLCMLMQAFGMVSFASEEMLTDEIILENDTVVEEDLAIELTVEKFSKKYVNDNFASGTDNWAVGQSQSGYKATVTTADVEGAVDGKALKITFPDKGSGSASDTGYYGSVIKLFDAASFSVEDTVTVKARVKADAAMNYQIKANRPDSLTQPKNDYTWTHYNALLMHTASGDLNVLGSGLYSRDIGGTTYNYRDALKIATNNDTNLWTEYTIVFKPADKKYYVTVVTTDATGNNTTVASNKTGYMVATKTELDTAYGEGYFDPDTGKYFLDLNSLTFTSRTAGNLYVDYVEVYGDRERVSATATVSETVTPSSDIVVNFAGDTIPAFPEGAVTVDGVACDVNADVTNQKITFTPKTKLTPGNTHTVRIDADAFSTQEGVTINGQTEFTVNVDYAQATAELLNPEIIRAWDSVTVRINSSEAISMFPDGLVTVNGVECTAESNVDEQTVTLTPVTNFEAGEEYTISVNADELQSECGCVLSGPSTFNFSITPISVRNLEIDGKPSPETTVGVTYDYEGVNGEGNHTYQWQTSENAGGPWSDLPNGTSSTYTFGYDLSHGCYVRVIMYPCDNADNTAATLISPAVMFKYVPSEEEDGMNFRKYYINDDFNTAGDVGNWKVGETAVVKGQVVTATQENLTENGETIGVMKFYAEKNDPDYVTNQQPYIDNDFRDIPFSTNSKIVIETRVKDMGGYLGNTETVGTWSGLKFNRPNQSKYLVETSDRESNINYRGWNGGTLFLIKHDTGLRYKSGSYQDSALAEGDYRDKWVNVKIVIDGTDGNMQDYSITVTDDNGLNVTQTAGTLNEYQTAMYDVPSAVDSFIYNSKSQHTDLRNLSFVLRNFADTMYIDYFRVYEIRPAQTATVSLPNGNSIRPADSVTVKFDGSTAIQEFAEGLVTIDGVECDVTSDINAQTVTVTPKQKLTANETYTLRVSAKVLSDSEGFVLEGTKEFTLSVTDVNVYDVITTGRTVPGTVMGVEYRYADSLADEGTHLYKWQKSTDGITWVDIDGETEDTYTVTQDIYDNENYVRIVMTPVDANGKHGLVTNGGFVIPETAPVLENVQTNTTLLFPDAYVTPVYDYIDPNNDRIVTKTVNWYSSTSQEGPWTLASTDENYYVTSDDIGKYFRFDIKIKNNATLKNETAVYESGVVGPVADIISSTNLLINSGFERGDLRGWNTDDGIIELAGKEGARTGNYAVHLMPRTNLQDSWEQEVNGLTAGKSYILSCWVKNSNPDLPNVTNFWPYIWSGFSRTSEDYSYLVGSEWLQATGGLRATGTSGTVDFVSFHSMNADCFIDDTYLGELIITDIETFQPEATEIPVEGTVKLAVTSGKIINQMGTNHGLSQEKVKVRIPEGVIGITQEGNNLVIDSSAVAGTYTVEVYCEPSYKEAVQAAFQKFVTIELLANNDKSPKARNVKATGVVKENSTLKGTYEYYQINGLESNSAVKWVYSDTFDGTYADIPGATSTNYKVTAQYADKFIKFAVLPATAGGMVGTWTYSDAITKAREPFATDVKISGDFKVGGTVSASYTHNDYNKDDEADEAIYQWYISSNADTGFKPIANATEATYTFTENDIDKYIKVTVTPVSKAAPTTGTPVFSEACFGPTAPMVENVTFSKNGLTLIGSYKYKHAGGAREASSIYKWTVDGNVVSSKVEYTIDFAGRKYVEFSVTPVGDTNPSTGTTYTYGAYVDGLAGGGATVSGGGGGGGSTGGSGGGGGGVGSTGVTNINDMKIPEVEIKEPEKTEPKSDLDGHWGEEYVKEMEKRGVMKADDKGNYDPDRIVSRAEMITYLFDALGLEESEYNAEFSDVSALDTYAGKLQTLINNGTIANYHEFRPNDGISRQEMCKILYVSLENADKLTKAETNVLDVFTDKALIADWAIDYVNTIYTNKIMIGTSDTTFAPTENITRAQVATMLVRILKVIEG